MRTIKITYWITTALVFLFDGVMPALTFNTQLAVDSIHHLGFPDYFRVLLTIFKTMGGILLILPRIPARLKELAYAGFTFNFISATVAHGAVDGVTFELFMPLIILVLLSGSYITYHRLAAAQQPVRGSSSSGYTAAA